MESLRTEEEQLTAIKMVWKSYGYAILLGLALLLSSVCGYKAWQNHQQAEAGRASGLYIDLLDIALSERGKVLTDEQKATMEHLSQTLKTDFESSIYAQFAALFKARNAVVDSDFSTAAGELKWLLLQKPEREMAIIARLRLAKVLLAQREEVKQVEALAVLDEIGKPGAFESNYNVVRGDVLWALGQRDDAREAYQMAIDTASAVGNSLPLVQMKLDDLAVSEETSE